MGGTPSRPSDIGGEPGQQCALVVDDEPSVRESVALVLESAGFAVRRAETAGEALAEAEQGACQVILVDFALPDAAGPDLVPRLRAACPQAKVIVITGRLSRADDPAAGEWGADAVLCKPFRRRDLLARIQGLLGD